MIKATQLLGWVCTAAVLTGPVAWFASLIDARVTHDHVRSGILVMVAGFVTADVVALAHLAINSRLPKHTRWAWVNAIFFPLPPAMWSALEYLLGSEPARRRGPQLFGSAEQRKT